MTVNLTANFLSNSRGITLLDGGGITWSINKNTNAITAAGGGTPSPLTTKGDLYGFSTVAARIPVGADTFVLTADSTQTLGLKWATPSPLTTKGDLYGFSTVPARVPVGVDGQILTADATQVAGLKWATPIGGSTIAATIPDLVYWLQGDVPLVSAGKAVDILPNSCPWRSTYVASRLNSGATVSATPLNTRSVLAFPGSNLGNYNLAGVGPVLQNATMFVVFNPTAIAAGAFGSFACGTTSASLQLLIDNSGHLVLAQSFTATIATSTGAIASSTWAQANATYTQGTGAFAFRVARAAAGSGTNAVGITTVTNGVAYDPQIAGRELKGSLAELIIYNRVLTLTEIQTVEAYLLSKWGV